VASWAANTKWAPVNSHNRQAAAKATGAVDNMMTAVTKIVYRDFDADHSTVTNSGNVRARCCCWGVVIASLARPPNPKYDETAGACPL